jgi:hypothetical protein
MDTYIVIFTVYRGLLSDTNMGGNLCSNSIVIFVACWSYLCFVWSKPESQQTNFVTSNSCTCIA